MLCLRTNLSFYKLTINRCWLCLDPDTCCSFCMNLQTYFKFPRPCLGKSCRLPCSDSAQLRSNVVQNVTCSSKHASKLFWRKCCQAQELIGVSVGVVLKPISFACGDYHGHDITRRPPLGKRRFLLCMSYNIATCILAAGSENVPCPKLLEITFSNNKNVPTKLLCCMTDFHLVTLVSLRLFWFVPLIHSSRTGKKVSYKIWLVMQYIYVRVLLNQTKEGEVLNILLMCVLVRKSALSFTTIYRTIVLFIAIYIGPWGRKMPR